jgi:TonB family protein
MEYYNPNDNHTKHYAAIGTIVVVGLIGWLASFINISVTLKERGEAEVVVAFEQSVEEETEELEPPKTQHQSRPSTDTRNSDSPAHVEESKEEPKSVQTKGDEPKTQTVNPNALFNPTESLSTESVATGNRLAPEGDNDSRSGEGKGYNLDGTDQLDAGLQGRGLREALKQPGLGYNTSGVVKVRVEVNAEGNVVSATMVQGSDQTLIDLAIKAAKDAKFNRAEGTSVGIITYVFKIH